MAGRAHVGVDAAVSAIRAPPHLGGLVDLDVFDDQRVHIQALRTKPSKKTRENQSGTNMSKLKTSRFLGIHNLRIRNVLPYLELSVALSIFEHVQEELGALLGPASLSPAELFGLEKRTNVSSHFCVTGRVGPSPEGAQTNDWFHLLSKGVLRWSSLQLPQTCPKEKPLNPPGHTCRRRRCSDGRGHTGV